MGSSRFETGKVAETGRNSTTSRGNHNSRGNHGNHNSDTYQRRGYSSGNQGQGNSYRNPKYTGSKCYRCGYTGHQQSDPKCPAKDKICNKCNIVGHFSSVCKTKTDTVRSVTNNEDVDYACTLHGDYAKLDTTPVIIGGVETKMLVDSGACNVINEAAWNRMKQEHVICDSKKESRTLLAYGTNKLDVIGTFVAVTVFVRT